MEDGAPEAGSAACDHQPTRSNPDARGTGRCHVGINGGDAAMAAASREPSGNPWELTDDALEPGSRRRVSAAVHATEFRSTGAPRIAAAKEQAAADPLPQRAYTPAGTTARGASLDVRDATQDAGVQFSVTLDFQPRIAPGGLSQLGHNHSPSPAHHSMGGPVSWWQATLLKDPVAPEAAAKPKSTQSAVRCAVAAHSRPRAN
ncbi:hypothetical protein HPB47_002984 [Ixodes persulcatus]|uniref:Uncharacterized protein n=1 Tax=Ixodes persulcatus TaxID=34615 RepID=A0AC60PJM7_IXOPE|nr:hypothetical protein HPB47_002984 [Ixodes persulcatus]